MVVSYSRLNRYRLCGISYYFHYILGKKYPPTIGMILGTAFHDTYKLNFKQKLAINEDMPVENLEKIFVKKYDKLVKKVRWSPSQIGKEEELLEFHKNKGLKLVKLFYPIAQKLIPLSAEDKYRVKIPKENLEIIIRPDLIVCDGIIDFKTKTRKSVPDFNQLLLYSFAYKELCKKPPKHLTFYDLIYTKTKEYILKHSIDGNVDAQPEILIQEVKAILKAIKNKIFFPAQPNSWKCSAEYCEYYDECLYGKRRHETYQKIEE